MRTKCKKCKRVTEHKVSGFEGYNRKTTCKVCGYCIVEGSSNW